MNLKKISKYNDINKQVLTEFIKRGILTEENIGSVLGPKELQGIYLDIKQVYNNLGFKNIEETKLVLKKYYTNKTEDHNLIPISIIFAFLAEQKRFAELDIKPIYIHISKFAGILGYENDYDLLKAIQDPYTLMFVNKDEGRFSAIIETFLEQNEKKREGKIKGEYLSDLLGFPSVLCFQKFLSDNPNNYPKTCDSTSFEFSIEDIKNFFLKIKNKEITDIPIYGYDISKYEDDGGNLIIIILIAIIIIGMTILNNL